MLRCIEIAKNGLGTTAPNPSVGAVIVFNNTIIGEGFTSPYGGPHAEVNAINSVDDKSLLKNATIYVTLEPCSHTGKTPPCADLLISHRIPKVVIGLLDPHEKVAGRGIQRLKQAGCEVTVGVLENECRHHHKRFLCAHEKKRPYIILKWAETLDGYIAPENKKRNNKKQPYWISNLHSRQLVHQWRAEEQAILVGTNTILEDNPKLDVRLWTGKNPLRVLIDKNLKIHGNYHVLDGRIPTLVLTSETNRAKYKANLRYSVLDFSVDLPQQICNVLHKEHISSIIIEGGAQTLKSFIDAKLWDEARIFTGSSTFDKGIPAPKISGKLKTSKKIDTDTLNIYYHD